MIETPWWCRLAVCGEKTSVDPEPGHHEGTANKQWPASSPSVNEDQGKDGHEDVDDVLNGRGDEVGVTCESSHAEHIGDCENC